MPTLYVNEYRRVVKDQLGNTIPAPMLPPLMVQAIPFELGGDPCLSEPFHADTVFIEIEADHPVSIAAGPSPVATPQYHRISANQRLYYGVTGGHRLSVVGNT